MNELNQQQREEAVRRTSDNLYRHLFENMSKGAAVYTAQDHGQDFLFVDTNRAAEQISGRKREDVTGKSVLELFPTVADFGLFEVFQRVWRTGEPEHHPVSEFREGDFAGWFEIYVYKLPSGEIVALFDDLTDRKLARDELTRHKELLNSIFEALDHPFFVINTADYHIDFANATARNQAGQFGSTTCHALYHHSDQPCDEDGYPCPLKEVVRTREPVTVEHIHFDAGGNPRTVEVHGFPLLDETGRVTRMIEYTLDITDRVQAEQRAREALAVVERERLAQELHDSVTQSIFSASIMAETLPQVLQNNPVEGQKGLEELRLLTRGALAEMRTMLFELRPAGLIEKPLGQLLENQAQAMSNRLRLPITLQVECKDKFPPQVQIALYRITQEALNNIAKHAQASNVAIQLTGQPHKGSLQISDDGLGFAPLDVLPDHMGLSIMHERAQSIDAALQIHSRLGAGTRITVAWPDEPDQVPHGQ